MERFNQKHFRNLILYNNIFGFFDTPQKLSSGRESSWYVNWRRALDDFKITQKLVEHTINFIYDLDIKPKSIIGVPEGMSLFGGIVQYEYAKQNEQPFPLSYARKIPKEHGSAADRNFIGTPKSPVLLIEDTITTAASLLRTINNFKAAGVEVGWVVALTDRMEYAPVAGLDKNENVIEYADLFRKFTGQDYGGKMSSTKAFEIAKLPFYPMIRADTLLPHAIALNQITTEKTQKIIQEREKFGIEAKPFIEIKREAKKAKIKA